MAEDLKDNGDKNAPKAERNEKKSPQQWDDAKLRNSLPDSVKNAITLRKSQEKDIEPSLLKV